METRTRPRLDYFNGLGVGRPQTETLPVDSQRGGTVMHLAGDANPDTTISGLMSSGSPAMLRAAQLS